MKSHFTYLIFFIYTSNYGQLLHLPSLYIFDINENYTYSLIQNDNNNIRQYLFEKDSTTLHTIPLETLKEYLYILTIKKGRKEMKVYFILPQLDNVYHGNTYDDYFQIGIYNLKFKRGCFYYDLSNYLTDNIYRKSDHKFNLKKVHNREILDITSVDQSNFKIKCRNIKTRGN